MGRLRKENGFARRWKIGYRDQLQECQRLKNEQNQNQQKANQSSKHVY